VHFLLIPIPPLPHPPHNKHIPSNESQDALCSTTTAFKAEVARVLSSLDADAQSHTMLFTVDEIDGKPKVEAEVWTQPEPPPPPEPELALPVESPSQSARKERLAALRAQIAATEIEGDEREKEADEIWETYNTENKERERKRKEATKEREARMKKLQDQFRNFDTENAEGMGFEDWRKSKGFEPPPSFDERFKREAPHFKRLLEKLKGMRGGVPFDAEAEADRWSAFQALAERKSSELTLDDIPIPTSALGGMSSRDFKDMARRYHPDKFMQRCPLSIANKLL